jgi:hypothetical protein
LAAFLAFVVALAGFSWLSLTAPEWGGDPSFELIDVLEAGEPVRGGFFGGQIDMDGGLLVVGEGGAGRAHVYDRDGCLVKTLLSPSGLAGSRFGDSVAVFGDMIVVGEWNASVKGVAGAGLIHFFDEEGVLIRSIGSPEPSVNARFGFSLDSDGVRLAVGETGELWRDENTTSRVYILDAGGAFVGSVERPILRMGSFGWSVGIHGDMLVVGEPYAGYWSGTGYTHGVVHVWDLDGWGRIMTMSSPVREGFGNFGFSVSVGEDVIGVGEVRGDSNGTLMAGMAHLYALDGTLRATLYPRYPKTYGYFGLPVVVSGDYVAVGQAGYVYLYDHGGRYVTTVSEEALAAADYGNDIAVDGDRLAAGTMLALIRDTRESGAVYLYRLRVAEPGVDLRLVAGGGLAVGVVVSVALLVWWRRSRRVIPVTQG